MVKVFCILFPRPACSGLCEPKTQDYPPATLQRSMLVRWGPTQLAMFSVGRLLCSFQESPHASVRVFALNLWTANMTWDKTMAHVSLISNRESNTRKKILTHYPLSVTCCVQRMESWNICHGHMATFQVAYKDPTWIRAPADVAGGLSSYPIIYVKQRVSARIPRESGLHWTLGGMLDTWLVHS